MMDATYFLEQVPQARLEILQQMGLGRYGDILGWMPNTAGNRACVQRFLDNPQKVKFPPLQGADLAGLVLDGVNFIRGNLSAASLRGASLRGADLLFANFEKADLREADLTGATCHATRWEEALVAGCLFGEGRGLSDLQKQLLQARGAFFLL
jgi:uncharacterized protein YjbI with pentapeptide repeats